MTAILSAATPVTTRQESTEAAAVPMGLVAIAESVPFIAMGVFGRHLIGRFGAWGRLAVVDALRCGCVALIPVVYSDSVTGETALLALVLVLGLLTSVFDPNLNALLPEEVDSDQANVAYGVFDLTARVARVVGPALAGVLLLVISNAQLLWLDAASFAVGAVASWSLARHSPRLSGDSSVRRTGYRRPTLPPKLVAAIWVHGATTFSFTAIGVGLPALLASKSGPADSAVYGFAMAAFGLGAVVLNPVGSRVARRGRFPVQYCIAAGALGAILAAMSVVTSGWVVVVLMFAYGACTPFTTISLLTFIADSFAGPGRSAVLAVDQTVIRSAGTAGMIVVPLALAWMPAATFALLGALVVVVALGGLTASFGRSRSMNGAEGRQDAGPQ